MSENILTHEYLKSILHYSVITGQFYWLKSIGKRTKANGLAGTMNSKGYINIGVNGKTYLSHRLAWFWVAGEWPANEIDHKNRVRDANYWLNIREATGSQNSWNKGVRLNNTSGYEGVSWNKKSSKWAAQININGKRKKLGYFESIELAYAEYHKSAIQLHGEFVAFQIVQTN